MAASAKKKTVKRIPKHKRRPCVVYFVEWGYVPKIGRGVIARIDAKKGTVLERSPVIVAPVGDFEAGHGEETILDHYLLTWEEKGEDIEHAVGLGYLMLYNHSRYPNAEFRYDYPNREIEVVALRDIEAGEEITHDYGGTWFTPRPEKPSAKKKAKKTVKKKPANTNRKKKTAAK